MSRWTRALALLWAVAGALSVAARAQVVLDFDAMTAGDVVWTQHPEAIFSSDPGFAVLVAADLDLGTSAPNYLCSGTRVGGVICLASVYVDFPNPVRDLTFLVSGDDAAGDTAAVRVFSRGVLSGTVQVTTDGVWNQPHTVDLSAFTQVSRIEIVGITDPAGLAFDDFSFTVEPISPAGVASCFGVGCPCDNDWPAAGCANSTDFGGILTGYGSASFLADDLELHAMRVPPENSALFYMGDGLVHDPFFDGFQCALGDDTFRFLRSIQTTTLEGTMTLGPGIAAESLGLILPSTTWHFHAWHRDVPGSPCGTGSNLTNLYSVTFGR